MTFNLPIFLTMAIFARPLLSIFGVDFVAGASGLIILAFATLFNASTGMCGSIITMTGHSKLNLANSIIDLTANIGLVLLFVPRWGIVGAALAGSLSIILINTMRLVEVFVLLRIWPYNPSFLKPIAAALVAAGVAYLANVWLAFLPTIAQIIAGAAGLWGAYALAIVLLKLSDEDRLVLNRLWSRFTPR
jgi:O-antigen/teichoic acid export membrane protein